MKKTNIFDPLALDAGRILAATAIFYFHVGMVAGFPLTYQAEKAVEYFVMLSGVAYVLFSRARPESARDFPGYLKRRVLSLLPIFLLVNLMFYVGSFFVYSALGRPYSFAEFLASSSGISMYVGWRYLSTVMWFMPFIVQVYCLLPLVDWLLRRTGPVGLLVLAFGLSLLLSLLVSAWVADPIAANLICKNWSPVFRLPEVCAGIILGRLATRDCALGSGLVSLGLFGGFTLLAGWLKTLGWVNHFYLPWGGFVLPVLIFAVSAALWPLLRHVPRSAMRELGTASFAFFLIHAAPIAAVSKRVGNTLMVWVVYYFVCWALAVGLTLAVGWLKKRWAGSAEKP